MFEIQFTNGTTTTVSDWDDVLVYIRSGYVMFVTVCGCGEILFDVRGVALRQPHA